MAQSLAAIRKLSDLNFVTIHHSAEEPAANNISELKKKAASWEIYHKNKDYDGDKISDAQYTDGKYGYKYILYHFLVARDGSVLPVQDIKFRRYHAADSARGKESHNEYGIAICVDGNYSQYKVKRVQKIAVAKIIFDLEKQLKKSLIVRTHKQQQVSVVGKTVYYPEKTGKYYTECAGETMGTHKEGACKEIIQMVNDLYKPIPTIPETPTTPPVTPEPPFDYKAWYETNKPILDGLQVEITQLREELQDDSVDMATLQEQLNNSKNNEMKAIEQLNHYRNNNFWVLLLEAIFSKKKV